MNTSTLNEILKYVIPALIMLIGTIITVRTESKKQQDLIEYRLKKLEEKQDKYNNLQGRMYQAEQDIAINKNDIKVANHRIEDLEHMHNA